MGVLYGRETSTPREDEVVFRFGGYSDRGRVRERNEDSFLFDETLSLAIVADGMGGHRAGEVASQMTIELIYQKLSRHQNNLRSVDTLRDALLQASLEIFDCGRKDISKRDMGSTVVALWLSDDRAMVAHVGDSRAYLCRNNEIKLLTRDHTLVQELVNAGRITPQEAETHRFRNVLSRAMGVADETEVDVLEFELEPGDRILLCSDGLYGYAAADAFYQLLLTPQNPDEKASSLVRLANECGGGDNITAVVVEVSGVKAKKPLDDYRDEPTLEMNSSQMNAVVAAVDQGLPREGAPHGADRSIEPTPPISSERNDPKTYEELPTLPPLYEEKPAPPLSTNEDATTPEFLADLDKTIKTEPILTPGPDAEITPQSTPRVELFPDFEKTIKTEPITGPEEADPTPIPPKDPNENP